MKATIWLAAAMVSLNFAQAIAADAQTTPATDAAAAPAAPATPAAPAAPAAPETATPAAAPSAAAAPANAGTGTVIFFRPKRFAGSAIGFIVREGTTELGKLRNGNYFSIQAPAGVHHYVVHSEAKDELTVEVEAGETYYVVGAVGVGFLAGRPNIAPSDAATYEAAKDKLSPSKPLNGGKAD
jgi:hypothetical protein